MSKLPNATTVAIIGAGFSGICAAIKLAQSGCADFLVLERAVGPGGVWHQNRYPGAACDIPSSLYSFSFVDDFDWSSSHGSWQEILDYVEHCIDRFGIRDRIVYGIDVAAAHWDAKAGHWIVETSSGRLDADYLVSACGLFNKPNIPLLKDLDRFEGTAFHSALWDQDFDARGKTVAVIGTGCSAAQFVPEIAADAQRLIVFQRSACHVMPKVERAYSTSERGLYARFPILRALERAALESGTEGFGKFQFDPEVRAKVNSEILASMSGRISDPEKRERLLPSHPVGGKRPISSDQFLAALDRDNVAIITDPIERVVETGLITADGQVYAADAIVFATGFLASDYLTPLSVTGEHGRDLQDTWKDGAYAYLGMLVDGFPNFFMIYGPNSNAVGSILQMIEPQAQFIARQITLSRQKQKIVAIDSASVEQFNADLQQALSNSVYGLNVAGNYFAGPSGKIVTQWPGTPDAFERAIASIDGPSLLRAGESGPGEPVVAGIAGNDVQIFESAIREEASDAV